MPRTAQIPILPPRSQDDRMRAMEDGKHAQVAFAYTRQLVSELEEGVIQRLIAKHSSGSLSDAELRGGIGEIAGLRNLLKRQEGVVQKGFRASEEELKHGG